MKLFLKSLLTCLVLCSSLFAIDDKNTEKQTEKKAEKVKVLRLKEGEAPAKAKIKELDWVAGYWAGPGLGGDCEEVWTKSQAGAMLGMFRVIHDGKISMQEFCTIIEEGDTLVYKIKHFDDQLKGQEEKHESQSHRLVKIEGQTAYFEGITVSKTAEDKVTFAVLVKTKKGEEVFEFHFTLKAKF
jgi:hypothetical protein